MSMPDGKIDAIHIILGILGTVSLFMVNSVTQAQVNVHFKLPIKVSSK